MQSKTEEIIVKSLDGNVINLREIYWGKPLLILFFNIQCLGCVGRAIPLAYDYLQEFKNLNVIAIHTTFGKEVVTKDDIINIFTHKNYLFLYISISKKRITKNLKVKAHHIGF